MAGHFAQPGPHGQKVLGLPRGISPSGITDDVVFNPRALMLIILLGGFGSFVAPAGGRNAGNNMSKMGILLPKKSHF